MEVAVRVGCDNLRSAEREHRFGRAAGLEALAMAAIFGLQVDPLDVVLRQHGMIDATNVDNRLVAFDLDHGNVLFMARVNAAGYELGHMLAAAGHRRAGRMDHANKIAADVTTEETDFTQHNKSLLD